MPAKPNHGRRERVFDFIVEYMRQHIRPPTLDEIVTALDIPKTTLHHHLSVLKDDGHITLEKGVSRGIGLPGARLVLPGDEGRGESEYVDDWTRPKPTAADFEWAGRQIREHGEAWDKL